METILSYLKSLSWEKLAGVAFLVVICLVVVKILMKTIDRLLSRSKLDKSVHAIIRSTGKILLIFLAVLIIAPAFGVETSSLLAVLSIAGVAVSLSIQDILSNFFSGCTLLLSKPFKIGDYVTAGGQSGTIVETGITHTKLHTPDNQVVLVPNSAITSNTITNFSTEDTRRLDLTFTAAYDSDPEAVKAALAEAADIPQVFADPAPFIRLSDYGESSIQYIVRVWVKNSEYWDAKFAILDRVSAAYKAHGVEMSYPHLNVHVEQ